MSALHPDQGPAFGPSVLLYFFAFVLRCFAAGYLLLLGVPFTMGAFTNPIPDFVAMALPLLYAEWQGHLGDPGCYLVSYALYLAFFIQRGFALAAYVCGARVHTRGAALTWGERFASTRLGAAAVDACLAGAAAVLLWQHGYTLAAKFVVLMTIAGWLGVKVIDLRVRRQGDLAYDAVLEARAVGARLEQRMRGW